MGLIPIYLFWIYSLFSDGRFGVFFWINNRKNKGNDNYRLSGCLVFVKVWDDTFSPSKSIVTFRAVAYFSTW
jgi:hypothetical protein